MAKIADSDAVKIAGRVLPQHQAALTLLAGRAAAPHTESVRWLDLACGRGQLILPLADAMSEEARSRIDYVGLDLENSFVAETLKALDGVGLKSVEGQVGDLATFSSLVSGGFDFITFTNTAHELSIVDFVHLAVRALSHLTEFGTFFAYDIELVEPPELGAVAWQRDDVRQLVEALTASLGAPSYKPPVSRWQHTTRAGWSTQIDRQHLAGDLEGLEKAAVAAGVEVLRTRARSRLAACRNALESVTVFGAETGEEEESQVALLREYWSLSRALHAEEAT